MVDTEEDLQAHIQLLREVESLAAIQREMGNIEQADHLTRLASEISDHLRALIAKPPTQ